MKLLLLCILLISEFIQLQAMKLIQGLYRTQHISVYNSSESHLQQSRQGKYVRYSPILLYRKYSSAKKAIILLNKILRSFIIIGSS